MLADYARTDGHRLRRVEPVAQATRELKRFIAREVYNHLPRQPLLDSP